MLFRVILETSKLFEYEIVKTTNNAEYKDNIKILFFWVKTLNKETC